MMSGRISVREVRLSLSLAGICGLSEEPRVACNIFVVTLKTTNLEPPGFVQFSAFMMRERPHQPS
jgi:hypothetical protein